MVQRPVGVTDVASGAGVADYRTRERSVGGDTVVEQYLVPQDERVASCKAMATTFRTAGIATANINLASLFNRTGSGVLVAVRRLSLQVDTTGASGTARTTATTRITTNPTTGTLLTPVLFDSAGSHAALVEFRGATASDGGAASTLTATPGSRAWGQFPKRNETINKAQRILDDPLVPKLSEKDPAYLREGEGLLVTNVDAASTSAFYIVNIVFEEFALP